MSFLSSLSRFPHVESLPPRVTGRLTELILVRSMERLVARGNVIHELVVITDRQGFSQHM